MKIELGKSINAVRFMHIRHYFRRTYGGSLSEVRYNKAKVRSKFAIKRATTRARECDKFLEDIERT